MENCIWDRLIDYWATVELILCPCLQLKWSKTHFTKPSFFTHQKQLWLTLWGCRNYNMYVNCCTMHMHSLHLLQHLAMDETLPHQTRCFPTIHSLILKNSGTKIFRHATSLNLHIIGKYMTDKIRQSPKEWLPPTQHFTMIGHVHKFNSNFFSYPLTCTTI